MRFRVLGVLIGLFLSGLSFAADQPSPQGAGKETGSAMLYIGTYTKKASKGIYTARWNPTTGTLSKPVLAAETPDPSFLAFHPSQPFLYAVNEGTAKVSAFGVAKDTGELKPLNVQGTGGDGPCHLAVDATGRMLVVANYSDGSIATFPLETGGALGPRAEFIKLSGSGPDSSRQEGPHAHQAVFTADNRFVFVNDLGTDRTMVYAAHPESAKLDAASPPFTAANPGAGPRHLAIDPKNRWVYVVNEMQSTVTRYAFDAKRGTLRKMDTISTLPPDFHGSNTTAEIMVARDGKTLYASNRGHDSVAVFRVNGRGALHLQQIVPTGGHEPRSFTLDPTGGWLLAANQQSDTICVFRVDRSSGKLTRSGDSIEVPTPVCLLFHNQ